jgi:(p)ppGpp synthase/HD superfamily hydrolase
VPALEDAIELALRVHRNMRDKAGAPYILHVLRVMLAVEGDTARMAAVLHDVVEDSTYTLTDLRKLGFPDEVVDTVDALTRRPGESYEAFIRRAATHPIARVIKLADLQDNLDLRRLAGLSASDWKRLQRYQRAWQFLKGTVA